MQSGYGTVPHSGLGQQAARVQATLSPRRLVDDEVGRS